MLKGEVDTKDRILKEAITGLLEEHGELLQKELQDKLQKSGNEVNQRRLSKTLQAMKDDKVAHDSKGKGNSKYWSLSSTSKQPQP